MRELYSIPICGDANELVKRLNEKEAKLPLNIRREWKIKRGRSWHQMANPFIGAIWYQYQAANPFIGTTEK